MFSRLRVPLCCPGDQLPGLAIVTDGARATPENRVEALESGWIEIAPNAAPGGGRFDSRAKCCRRKRMLLIAPCQAGTTTSSGLDADALRKLPLSGDCLWRTVAERIRGGFDPRPEGPHTPRLRRSQVGDKAEGSGKSMWRVWKGWRNSTAPGKRPEMSRSRTRADRVYAQHCR